MNDVKLVKLELWAVSVAVNGGYVGMVVPEGTAPEDLPMFRGIGWGIDSYGETRTFETPDDVADHVQRLLRTLSEGKVGRG